MSEGNQTSDATDKHVGIRFIGRYALLGKLAAGGMATVHVGRLLGPVGFTRMVAIKRLHPEYARDPEFVSMFLDEARLAANISHPNVVATLDVVATGGELFLVMDYIHGQSLSWLIKNAAKKGEPIPPRVVGSIISGCLQGLHAAHEARDERGVPLNIVHRDVSPQNMIVGGDGLARVLDFGVAKAAGRIQNTREGHIKGKLAYMPPEQLQTDCVTRQADVYATAVVLWEALTSTRLFKSETETGTLAKILSGTIVPPSIAAPWVPAELDAVVMKGLERDVTKRYATAREMAAALERCGGVASIAEVSEWLERVAKKELEDRAARIAAIEMSAGLTNNGMQGLDHLAQALAAAAQRPLDDDSSSSVGRASKGLMDTVPASIPPPGTDLPAAATVKPPGERSARVTRPNQAEIADRSVPIDTTGDLGDVLSGESHAGESASQLSSVSLALGHATLPPYTRPRNVLLGASVVGLAAMLVAATLWLARPSPVPTSARPATAARPAPNADPKPEPPVEPARTLAPNGTTPPDSDAIAGKGDAGVELIGANEHVTKAVTPRLKPAVVRKPATKSEKPTSPFQSLGGRE